MSAVKRHIEDEVERIAKASGYDWCLLMDSFNEEFKKSFCTERAIRTVEKKAMNCSYAV